MKKPKKDQLEVILDSIADGVFTIDLDKQVTSFNKAAERITGIPREQAIGQNASMCFIQIYARLPALWRSRFAQARR